MLPRLDKGSQIKNQRTSNKLHQFQAAIIPSNHAIKQADTHKDKPHKLATQSNIKQHLPHKITKKNKREKRGWQYNLQYITILCQGTTNGEKIMAVLLKADQVRAKDLDVLKEKTASFKKQGITPLLKVVLAGDDPASILYTSKKKKYMESFGASCDIIRLPAEIKEKDFLQTIDEIVHNPLVHGVLIQMPLPKGLESLDVGSIIPGNLDVDGLSPHNFYRLAAGRKGLIPCTPKGISGLLEYYNLPVEGQNVVIIGRSMIVGKPLAALLANHNATVTLCHSRTKNIPELCQKADIIVCAIGRAKFLTKDYIGNNHPVVIDVGINRDAKGKLCGDVDFTTVAPLAKAITPVPGGVGPMTIHSLAQNLLEATANRTQGNP